MEKKQLKEIEKKNEDLISLEILESMFHNLNVAVMAIDIIDGRMLYFNEKVCTDMEFEADNLSGKKYKEIFTPDFKKSYEQLKKECRDGEIHTIVYYWSNKSIWEQVSAKMFKWSGGTDVILMTITNITDVARAEYEYKQLAYYDSLTGLPNGKKLEEDINDLVNVETVVMIYFQIEGFYEINDLYGFDAGDSLLLQVRDWLLFSETKDAQLYRGSEGIVVLGHKVTMDNAIERAEKIVDRFNQPWVLYINGNNYSVYCHVRVGIVYGKYVKNEMRTLLLRSLRAPVTPGGYSIYDEEEDKKAKEELTLRQTFINCVYNNMEGFRVYYQPIVDGTTEKWVGAEALCRWRTPDGIDIPPLDFIHHAEKLKLISKLDNWVRERSMNDCMIWGMNTKNFFLDVNFSPNEVIDDIFIDRLMINLKKTGYPAIKLTMEITESAKMKFDEVNLAGLRKLKEKGIIFSLDDFGTGYSSFENLIKIPASNLKTEKVFLENIENNKYKQYLLKMLIELAHHLNMKIICEGVETEGQKKLLKEYGVDCMQGYLFSKPMNREKFEQEIWRYDSCK